MDPSPGRIGPPQGLRAQHAIGPWGRPGTCKGHYRLESGGCCPRKRLSEDEKEGRRTGWRRKGRRREGGGASPGDQTPAPLGSSDPPAGQDPREARRTSTFVNDLSETSALLFCSVRPATGCGPRSDPRATGSSVTIHDHGGSKSAGPAPGSAGEATEAQGGRELRLGRAGVQREGQSVGPRRGGLA